MDKNLIMQGAEPFLYPGNRTGVLLVHGFTGTPHEMVLPAEFLRDTGYTVLGIRLTGHGTSMDDLVRCRWHDWLADIESGLNQLKTCTDHQIVVGLSMGAALALIAAARYSFDGVIAISAPAYFEPTWQVPLIPFISLFIKSAGKGKSDWHDDEQRRGHVNYPVYPLRGVVQYVKVLETLASSLDQISMPAMLVQSSQDNTIPKDSLERIAGGMNRTRPEALWVHNSNHMVTMEPDRQTVFNAMHTFIQRATQ